MYISHTIRPIGIKMRNLFFVGTAGSGKSTLVGAFKEWLEDAAVDSIIVNLDPGAESLPYEPDIDIREWISLEEVMREYGLGPNGAQIVAADLMAVNINKMTDILDTIETDYVLVDTPGQLELFAFRESSERIISAFGKEESMLVYLSDPNLCKTPNGFISSTMLSAIVQFRLQLPSINMLSKSDLFKECETERMLAWFNNSDILYDDLMCEMHNPESVAGAEILKALDGMGTFGEILPVSAQENKGLADIYAAAQLEFFGGEDSQRE
jgi:GTPase SAR1 family protein